MTAENYSIVFEISLKSYHLMSFVGILKALKLTDLTGTTSQDESMVKQLEVPNAQDASRMAHRPSVFSQDIDLSDTVANFVDFVKEGRQNRHRYR